ncbi:Protein shisa-4 [Amphibalanus amphitrite]|uniref:Protein shisa-4 n=1 Tax=Amphibalanus amphitrite TaxID=1232801 RepID=A0A6A4WSD2_AMPAM|nr:Protein shisa-4 [Amphibalanus amphitrite]
MSNRRTLGENHEVLSRNAFCSGYVDSFGKWNNGFPCPRIDDEEVFCCGTTTYRYCCSGRVGSDYDGDSDRATADFLSENLPLVLGVAAGALITLVLVIIISCFYCSCCAGYKKRSEAKRDRMYASTSSGVANMYSCSTASLGRRDFREPGRDSRREQLEDMLHIQEVMEVASVSQRSAPSLPRTFRHNRASLADSVGNASVSTTTDNERQLFVKHESVDMPPIYNLNKLSNFEEVLPYPPSFASERCDFGSGHYIAGMSPNDDNFYRATKM